MAIRDDERSLKFARLALAGCGVVALIVLTISIVNLVGAGDPEQARFAETRIETAQESDEPDEQTKVTSSADQAQRGPNLAGIPYAAVAEQGDLDQLIDSREGWMPDVIEGPEAAEISLTVLIDGGGTESFLIADSANGLQSVRAGATLTYPVREGEITIVQDVPTGWAEPEMVCTGGLPVVSGIGVTVKLEQNGQATCTFANARFADSLGVTGTLLTCEAFFGIAHGPTPPFIVSYQVRPALPQSPLEPRLGHFRVDDAGPFLVPFDTIQQMP